jgi:ATP-dependent DNA ligase
LTTVSVYSVRAKSERPLVSMPISWKEVESAVADSKPEHLVFTPEEAVKRVNRVGDLFAPVLNEKQTLPKELLHELGLAETEPRTVAVTIPEQQEPRYSLPRSSGQGGRKLFVVHRGVAGFELGLEVEGSFRSFTMANLPKGKEAVTAHSATPQELTYLTDESSEGGIVWDLGTYEVVEGSYARGDVIVYLSGRKLEGQWHLTQTSNGEWRIGSEGARIKRDLPLDGSSLPEDTKAADRQCNGPKGQKEDRLPGSDIPLAELPAEEPRFVKKMDCVAVNRVEDIPAGPDWTREVKWDGYRVCVVKRAGSAAIRTKSNKEPGARYQHIVDALAGSTLPDCTLDAELVALREDGRPSFQLLQQSRRNRSPIVIYVFDLLNYRGRDLKRLPLAVRRSALEATAPKFPEYVRVSDLLPEDTPMDPLVAALDEHGLEGIVVKRKDSTYLEGKEPGTWIKYRLYEIDEFVIGGYLKRKDPFFDALIVGQYEGDRLIYKEKVRFGFDDEKKQRLLKLMKSCEIPDSPFSNLPEGKRRGALDREQMAKAVWVRPELRCTVEYTEKTERGNIRGHGRFEELRP